MSQPINATAAHIAAINQLAVNAAAVEMRIYGVCLTHAQADEIDATGHNWLRNRLGLTCVTDDMGVTYSPASANLAVAMESATDDKQRQTTTEQDEDFL